jgi:hypothetical protein
MLTSGLETGRDLMMTPKNHAASEPTAGGDCVVLTVLYHRRLPYVSKASIRLFEMHSHPALTLLAPFPNDP